MFDGERVWEGAAVTIEEGKITSVKACAPEECGDGFLMPGLTDAHTHMESMAQADCLLRSGVTATFDVDGNMSLVRSSDRVRIISSAGMAMGVVMNPRGFVERAAQNGARYIKVLLFSPRSVGKRALAGITDAAHERGLKVVVHATAIETVRQAVDAGADVLLHVPMKEEYPAELAETIARKGIASAPTLVMMETFAGSGRNGYIPEHFPNALKAVRLQYEKGVRILVATDANSGGFAPEVKFGAPMHREMELLASCGIPPVEILAGATSKSAEAFGIDEVGMIREGASADMLLIDGRPDKVITDTTKIRKIWIGGNEIER